MDEQHQQKVFNVQPKEIGRAGGKGLGYDDRA